MKISNQHFFSYRDNKLYRNPFAYHLTVFSFHQSNNPLPSIMQHAIVVFLISLLFLHCAYVEGQFLGYLVGDQTVIDAIRRAVVI
jgi:hypothetical protein